jgi:hypothetical protein
VALAANLEKPCRQLAAPVSRCLVEETDASGNSLAVVSDLLSGHLGETSELVVKRCAARLLGLPPTACGTCRCWRLPTSSGPEARPSPKPHRPVEMGLPGRP